MSKVHPQAQKVQVPYIVKDRVVPRVALLCYREGA